MALAAIPVGSGVSVPSGVLPTSLAGQATGGPLSAVAAASSPVPVVASSLVPLVAASLETAAPPSASDTPPPGPPEVAPGFRADVAEGDPHEATRNPSGKARTTVRQRT